MSERALKLGSLDLAISKFRWGLWVLLILTIPVTSFPYIPAGSGMQEALVRPLSLYPLIFLLILEVGRVLRGKSKWSNVIYPLAIFTLLAIAGSALALASPTLELRGETALSRSVRGLGSLGLGLGFYWVAFQMNESKENLISSIRWIMTSMMIAVAWGFIQGIRLLFRWPRYAPLNAFQRLFSIRDMHELRVNSFAFEPSWFADQLVVLALPLLISAILYSFQLFPRYKAPRWLSVSIFLITAFVLVMTYSRGGILTFILSALLGVIVYLWSNRGRLRLLFNQTMNEVQQRFGRIPQNLTKLGLVILFLVGLVATISLLSQNSYFRLLWERLWSARSLQAYILSIGAGPRLALAESAIQVFRDHPWFGVSLGHSGFYMFDTIPMWVYERRSEVVLLLSPESHLLPNPKNLWIRILSETGLIGFTFFVSFIGLIGSGAYSLVKAQGSHKRFLGLVGLMSLTAIILEGFSLDSFALPTIWIILGLLTAGIEIDLTHADT